MAKINDAGSAISVDAIEVLESWLESSLPRSYREFLMNYGGGYPEPDCYRFAGEKEGSDVQRFYGLNRSDSYDLVKILKVFDDRIPKELMPIARDSGGNQICIGLRGVYREKIYFWDHEQSPSHHGKQFELKLIASSFVEFLQSLEE